MKKRRIAIFAENLYGGGVERILQIVMRNLDYDRYAVTLYSQRPEVLQEDLFPTNKIEHRHIFDSGGGICAKIKNKLKLLIYYHFSPRIFYRIFIRWSYDVGIAFIEGYATRYLAGAPRRMKKIAWVHCDLHDYHWTQVAFHSEQDEARCYQSMNQIVTVARSAQKAFHRAFPQVTTPISTIYNPIDSDEIRRLAGEEVPLPAKRQGVTRLVTAGRFSPQKKLDRLLRIVRQLIDEGFHIELWMLGEGELRPQLEQLISQLRLEDVVTLWGFKENPYPFLVASDLYVGSSVAEGFCTAFTECLILGVPVITTEVSGAREQLGEHNEWGIITANDEQALCEGIRNVLHNQHLLAHYREQAAIRGRDFTLEASMQAIHQLIDSTLLA
ncbi:MAG: glycosyltransferase [Muribaculaceae bacterium]|nr:glycosyltransferase [Muribaculaceae bacterium]